MRPSVARYILALLLAAVSAVGIAASADAQSITLPVPLSTIYPGDPINASALGERTFDQSRVGTGFVDSRSHLVGKIARRTLLPDHPIAINAIADISLVNRGTPVQLVFKQAGLLITAYASPLQDGSVGDLIHVRNEDSGAIVIGVVQPDGTVRVGQQ